MLRVNVIAPVDSTPPPTSRSSLPLRKLSLGSRAQESATGTKAAEGAYSDILGVGEEAVWSNVNGSLAVRQKNITILVMTPNDKATQVKVAQEVLRVMR